jgi:uncharacterized protein
MNDNSELKIRRDGEAWILPVYVQPGARREGIAGIHGDAIKLAVNAPPEKGKANKAVEELIARELGIRPSAVQVISGLTSRRKNVRVEGASAAAMDAFLNKSKKP